MTSYLQSVPAATRATDCTRMLAKQPGDAIAIVCEPVIGGFMRTSDFKTNFVVLPPTATVADLLTRIRDFSEFRRSKPLSVTVNDAVPSSTTSLGDLYAACKNEEDGFLYVKYAGEKSMGVAMKCHGPVKQK